MSVDTPVPDPAAMPRLAYLPVALFGMTMGLLGLGLAVYAAGFATLSFWIGGVGSLVLAVLLGAYALKALRYPGHVAREWGDPVRLAFFPAASLSVILIALLICRDAPALARPLWIVGAGVQAVMTVIVFSAWISHRAFGPGQLSPAWFIPAVGNAVVPAAGVPLGYVELSWYFFAVGVLFWIVLLTLVFNRLIFHDPMPGRMRPTLVILIAPPAVACLAWLQLNGGVLDAPARIFINLGYFFAALVAVRLPSLLKLPFALSFWALSFPLAALTSASFQFGALADSALHRGIGWVLLALLCVVIGALSLRTLKAALAGQICVPD
ncbi:tellurite resistance protein [Roseivivax lentus]|uniref:Tellurite resistance protein n=1 Tax=Roseivivax lentus TaxID=633194 RepID=A0A1N7P1V2_9RHOB|nr:SLAC1 anion channel family protein [Roseivivax lentus]SIT04534.1 tellurite resistance protein [Roseivivax lentus]